MPEISSQTRKLISNYKTWYQFQRPKEGAAVLHADEIASKVAAFYEKIRIILDWKEEHLMRRAAVERVLKRKVLLREEGEKIAESFILELIRAGHFPNDRIPEAKIEEVQRIIDKYAFIIKQSPAAKEKSKIHLYNWILGLAACEIEEALSFPLREISLINYMAELMQERIKLSRPLSAQMTEEEKNTQIYIAVQRALFKLDQPIITYGLLKRKYPQWRESTLSDLQEISVNVYSVWEALEGELNHPLAERFYRVCEKYDTVYLLLGDIVSEGPLEIEEKISRPDVLENLIKQSYNKRLGAIKVKLGRAALYYTLSIFFTKIAALLALEAPLSKYVVSIGHLNGMSMAVNILAPTSLMLFLLATIRPPKRENLAKVILETMKIVYQKEIKDFYEIKLAKRRGPILNFMLVSFYVLNFCLLFWLIIWGLGKLHFSIFSSIIFIVFISLIAFAGTKLRERAKELEVIEKKEGFSRIIIDPLSVPVIQLGRWLSQRWQKYNVITVFFNLLIDAPFMVFVEFLEHWRYFLKEKKEKIH